ncbi:MAG: hypothetical protein ABI655_10305 [Phenylobacterium sp.]
MTTTAIERRPRPLGLLHCTFTGAAVLGILFLLLWTAEAVADIPASKAFLGLITRTVLQSPPQALAEGIVWAVVLGGVIGALIAFCFNLFAVRARR